MTKRLRDEDHIELAIHQLNQNDFYKATIGNKFVLTHYHFQLLDEKNLLFKWIDEEHYKQVLFECKEDVLDFLFKYDDVENYKIYFDENNTYHLYSLLYHSATQCLFHYLSPEKRLFTNDQFFASALKYAMEHKTSLSTIQILVNSGMILLNKLVKKQKTCLDYAIKYQTMDVIKYLISKGAKFWNAKFVINTELEKQFLIEITNTSNWEEACKLLSISTKQLRSSHKKMNFESLTDLKLHTDQNLFYWGDEKPLVQYSNLFKELWHRKLYASRSWNFIPPIESIINEYLFPLNEDLIN